MAAILQFQQLKLYKDLLCAVSTRQYGSIKEKGNVFQDNLENFLKDVQPFINSDNKNIKIVFTKQVHGNKVIYAQNTKKQILGDADGLITNKKHVVIGMATADCLPVVFFDQKKQIVGVAHAGYKGLLAGILENMVKEFKKFGSKPENILVGIGPGIQACCYDVKSSRIGLFKKKFSKLKPFAYEQEGRTHLDLPRVAKYILLKNGILADNIEDSGICTSDANDLFFSFRKETKKTFGEFATVIGML